MEILTDLHTHTIFSDGDLHPQELIKKARQKGLKALAITDHDTIDGLKQAHIEARKVDIDLIPGIELTCKYKNNDQGIHMLGLGIDYDEPFLLKKLEKIKSSREKRAERIIDMLETYKWRTDPFIFEKTKGTVTTYDIARSVINKNISTIEFYNRWLSESSPCYIDMETFKVSDAIELIHKAGGNAICAHLQRSLHESNRTDDLQCVAEDLVKKGLDGFEVFYGLNTKEQMQTMSGIADRHKLLKTGGSDYHGPNRTGKCPLGGYLTHGIAYDQSWITGSLSKEYESIPCAIA